jgi:hypothetical protein
MVLVLADGGGQGFSARVTFSVEDLEALAV